MDLQMIQHFHDNFLKQENINQNRFFSGKGKKYSIKDQLTELRSSWLKEYKPVFVCSAWAERVRVNIIFIKTVEKFLFMFNGFPEKWSI